jgi:hypothetical protein
MPENPFVRRCSIAASRCIEELQSATGSHALVGIAVGPIREVLTETARRFRLMC